MKKKDLSDLEKARNHFVKAATECIIGAGFALKGVSGLLRDRDGRKLFTDFAIRFIGKGIGLAASRPDLLKPVEESRPKRTGSRSKRTRKS